MVRAPSLYLGGSWFESKRMDWREYTGYMLTQNQRYIGLGMIALIVILLIGVGVYDYYRLYPSGSWTAIATSTPSGTASTTGTTATSTASHAADLVAGGPYQVKVAQAVPFATVGGQTLVMYIYTPIGAKYPTPFVAYTHGGGFAGGNVDGKTDLASEIAARGYAFVSIDYQTSDVATMPAPIEDDFAGIRYLRAHAAEYNLDPSRVITMGASAGSELATLVGVVANDPSYWGTVGGNTDQSNSVQGIVGISGVWDSHDLSELDKKHAALHTAELGCTDLLGPDCQDAIHKYFPDFHLDAGDPPTLFLQGGKNSASPPDNARDLTAAMKAVGIDVTLFVDPDLGDTVDNAMNHMDLVNAFLDRVFSK